MPTSPAVERHAGTGHDLRPRYRRLAAPLLAGAGGLAAMAYVRVVDPSEPGHYLPCPLFRLTGLYCPLCGMTRAAHDLASADVAGAMARNPLVIPVLVLAVGLWGTWLVQRWRRSSGPWRAPAWLPNVLAVVLVVFGVARNVPGWTWLSPV